MQNSRCGTGGFTLLEMMLALIVLVTLIFVVVQLAFRTSDAQRYATLLNRSTEINQDLLQGMRSDLLSSVKLFQNDAKGNAYLDVLDMTLATPAINSTLPTFNDTGVFGQEPGTGVLTGNTLMFAKHAWTAEYECLSGNIYMLEVYRIVRNYLAEADGGPQPSSPLGLNLCRWVSEPMVDGNQVDAITDTTDRAEILDNLLNRFPDVNGKTHVKVEVVWKPGQDPVMLSTFRHIGLGGFLSSAPLAPRAAQWKILRDPKQSSNGLLHFRHFSVASNYSKPSFGVGRYSVMSSAGDGFPHGFEVQIIGPSSGRQVLLQLTVVSTVRRGLPAVSSFRVVVNTREI